jgi:hypothetical protein
LISFKDLGNELGFHQKPLSATGRGCASAARGSSTGTYLWAAAIIMNWIWESDMEIPAKLDCD